MKQKELEMLSTVQKPPKEISNEYCSFKKWLKNLNNFGIKRCNFKSLLFAYYIGYNKNNFVSSCLTLAERNIFSPAFFFFFLKISVQRMELLRVQLRNPNTRLIVFKTLKMHLEGLVQIKCIKEVYSQLISLDFSYSCQNSMPTIS